MNIKDLVIAIIVIAGLIFCFWKFDSKLVLASVLLASSLINLYKIIKSRNRKQ